MWVNAQPVTATIADAKTGISVPFASCKIQGKDKISLANIRGKIDLQQSDSIYIDNPLYKPRWWHPASGEAKQVILLDKKTLPVASPQALAAGLNILKKHHDNLAKTSTLNQDKYYYLSKINLKVFESPRDHVQDRRLKNEFELIEKNKYVYPDKRYRKVVNAHFADGDSLMHSYLPTHNFTITEDQEFISALNLKYFNPLHKDASDRYDFILLDSIYYDTAYVQQVYFKPKKGKNFTALSGILYFSGKWRENVGGYLFSDKNNREAIQLAFYQDLSERHTRYMKNMRILLDLKSIPNFRRHTLLEYNMVNGTPIFDQQEMSSEKWINMALFDYQKNTSDDDTWMMSQVVDREKLEYLRKDTTKQGFISTRTLNYLVNIYDGRLGYRLKYFDLKNVFSINKIELMRLGIGLQTHERLSDRFTFGGYVGYGLKDAKIKYGANIGIYPDYQKNTFISMKYAQDLQEPGLVHYLDKQQDLIRKFFTSRMDDYQSFELMLRRRINASITSAAVFNNFTLTPLYDYQYNPTLADSAGISSFSFQETSLLFNLGTPLGDYPAFQDFIFHKKKLRTNLSVNITKGWNLSGQGKYDYWKINSRLDSKLKLTGNNELHMVLDGGLMTPDMPYEVNYGGPGTEFKLTGIIIKNAFQTMKLYGFFADRYIHSFTNYDFGNILPNNKKFKPELALALNAGWGKIQGDKTIHEQIEVRDYPKGFYEAGILLNNLLRLKVYRYFYGSLGVGTFVGYDPNSKSSSFAVRLSYELGTLM